jgi:hypothetical protein
MKLKYKITAFKMSDQITKECHTSDIGKLMQSMADHGLLVVNYHEVGENPNDIVEITLGKEGHQ